MGEPDEHISCVELLNVRDVQVEAKLFQFFVRHVLFRYLLLLLFLRYKSDADTLFVGLFLLAGCVLACFVLVVV